MALSDITETNTKTTDTTENHANPPKPSKQTVSITITRHIETLALLMKIVTVVIVYNIALALAEYHYVTEYFNPKIVIYILTAFNYF